MTKRIRVRPARLDASVEIETLFEILDSYAGGPGGQGSPLSEESRRNLGSGLRAQENYFVLFGCLDERVVGVAVCFWGFSTFAGRPFVNLHDFAVLPEAQSKGVGTALLLEIERRARRRGCCKITLEVRDANERAKDLYARSGFEGFDSPTWFVAKPL